MNVLFDPKEYYKRQVVLYELGPKGQEKLRKAKVLVVGVGGLGTASTLYLALAGVGYIRLVDQDVIELSNLHRQVLFSLNDFRIPKVEAAAKRINEINPEVEVDPIPDNIRDENVDEIVKGVDCIVDGLDNMRTRYLINRASVKYKIPYVFGGAIGLEGNIAVLSPPETACLECFLPDLDDARLPTCETRGVLGATTGIVGSIQAMEAIKLLAGINSGLKGKLLVCDFTGMDFYVVNIDKNPKCKVCGEEIEIVHEIKRSLTWLCGSNTVNVNPPKPLNIDLSKAYEILKNKFKILVKSSLALTFSYGDDIEVTLFKRGRMLIRNIKSEDDALKIYEEIIKTIS